MNKKLCSDLKKVLNTYPIYSQNHVNETINVVCKEYENYKGRQRIGYIQFLFRQILFIGRKVWMYQGVILILMFLMLNIIFDGDFQYIVNGHIPDLLCFYAVFITITGLPFLHRSRQYRMYEVELAACMSISKLVSSRLIIVAIGDSVFLITIALIMLNKVNISTIFIIFYLLLPFLVCCCGCIFILSCNHKQYGVFICEIFCLLVLPLQVLFHTLVPQAYYQTSLIGWIVLSIFFAVILAFQVYQLIAKSNKMYDYSVV